MSNLGNLGLNQTTSLIKTERQLDLKSLETRKDVMSQMEAFRDLEQIENIPNNQKLLSGTRKGVKNLPSNVTIGNVNRGFRALSQGLTIDELTAKDLPTLKFKGDDPTNKVHKDLPGENLTSNELRTYNTTGFYKGKFRNPLVLEQAKNLKGKWPKWSTGESKSLEGFITELKRGWNIVAKGRANLKTKRSSTKHVRGHITDAASGGSNWPGNIVNQPESSLAKGLQIGEGGLVSNETLRKTLKHPDDLKMAGFTGESVAESFQEYLMAGDKSKYKTYNSSRFTEDQRSIMAHKEGRTAESLGFEFEQKNNERLFQQTITDANPPPKTKVKANRLFQVVRHGARVAGQSPNPIANVGGDIVGVVMDGAAFLQDPKNPENVADLTLSGGQMAANLVAAGLTLVPGAQGAAYIVMKGGDNLGKIERIWNMMRPPGGYKQFSESPLIDVVQLKKKANPISEADKQQIGPIQRETMRTPLSPMKIRK